MNKEDHHSRKMDNRKPHPQKIHAAGRPQNNHLIDVYNDTKRLVAENPSRNRATLCQRHSTSDDWRSTFADMENEQENAPAQVVVRNTDTLVMARDFIAQHPDAHVAILNMASEIKPGGGVERGSRAQEEEIFRRTNAVALLPRREYPLGTRELLFSTPLVVLKDTGYYRLDQEFACSMISCAAVRKPRLDREGRYADIHARSAMESKIDLIFLTAVHHGVNCLVLGAFGCGAFGNPPTEVAALFAAAVKRYETCFTKIGFAVLVARDEDRANLAAFEQAFPVKK